MPEAAPATPAEELTDRALLDCVDKEPDKALVARKLMETAQGLGLQTIAEAVERREE